MQKRFHREKKSKEPQRLTDARQSMVEYQLIERGIKDKAVLDAMRLVPRHMFIDRKQQATAYTDGPASIGEGQTISQPYVVASMTEQLKLRRKSRVLEIGTGCGYQTAILAELTPFVLSVERIPALMRAARQTLRNLGYNSVKTLIGDGSFGWPEHAPYDAIIVTAAAPKLPETLVEQLAENGRLVIPVGDTVSRSGSQHLYLFHKTKGKVERTNLFEVRFVPMRGQIADGLSVDDLSVDNLSVDDLSADDPDPFS